MKSNPISSPSHKQSGHHDGNNLKSIDDAISILSREPSQDQALKLSMQLIPIAKAGNERAEKLTEVMSSILLSLAVLIPKMAAAGIDLSGLQTTIAAGIETLMEDNL